MARLPQLRAWTLTGRSIRLATESTWLNPFSAYACPASSLILQVSMPTSPKAIQSWLAYASNSSMSSSPNDPGYSPRHGKAHPSVSAQIRRISSLLRGNSPGMMQCTRRGRVGLPRANLAKNVHRKDGHVYRSSLRQKKQIIERLHPLVAKGAQIAPYLEQSPRKFNHYWATRDLYLASFIVLEPPGGVCIGWGIFLPSALGRGYSRPSHGGFCLVLPSLMGSNHS